MPPIRTLLRVASVLVALAASACGPAFVLDRPDDFLTLDEHESRLHGYEFRATSADGVVVAVRKLENRGHGSLAFWTESIRNQLRYGSGYAIVEEASVRAASGEEGTRLSCGRDQAGVAYTYWVTVFVADDELYVVEAGGPRDVFEVHRQAVEVSLTNFRVR